MTEQNLALTQRWYEEVWNQKREATIDELLSKEAKGTGLGEGGVMGFYQFKEIWRNLVETFPDLHVEIEDYVANGDKVSVHLACTGTHRGKGLGIAPTGKPVKFEAQIISTWKNGQIVLGRNVVDMSPVFTQA